MPARSSIGTTAEDLPERYRLRVTVTGPAALVSVSVPRSTR